MIINHSHEWDYFVMSLHTPEQLLDKIDAALYAMINYKKLMTGFAPSDSFSRQLESIVVLAREAQQCSKELRSEIQENQQ